MFNSNGIPVDGRAGSHYCRAPIAAEASALLAAVRLAEGTQLPTLIFSDCNTLIASLNTTSHLWPWEGASLIAAITDRLRCCPWIEVHKCSRSRIQIVDSIVRQARIGLLQPSWLSYL
ncbi:hypothetical protein LINGRAHAP2_LOCUS4989 [Linum grandiflorum]